MKVNWGWIILEDLICYPPEKSRFGFRGGNLLSDGSKPVLIFRMLDDDGEIYYKGLLIDDDYGESQRAALDFGIKDAGCTIIQVRRNGKWVTEID